MARRVKQYLVSVMEDGARHEYVYFNTSRRRVKAEATRYWGNRFVECRPALRRASSRRLVVVAVATFAVGGVVIATAMVIALSLDGA
jgi:hypothetical protein